MGYIQLGLDIQLELVMEHLNNECIDFAQQYIYYLGIICKHPLQGFHCKHMSLDQGPSKLPEWELNTQLELVMQ